MTATLQGDVDARKVLLGLPCARCRAYYPVGLHACPVCGCVEKVSADRSSIEEFGVPLAIQSVVHSQGSYAAED
jgi:hypothetical protein